MAKKRAVEFLVDEKGHKKSVLMSYKTYVELMEDIADLQVIAQRRDEKPVPLEDVLKELEDAGRV